MSLREAASSARDRQRREDQRYAAESRERDRWAREQRSAREEFLAEFDPATVQQYTEWLTGFVNQGGEITHVYDYPFDRRTWVYVDHQCTIPELFGALSINLIIAPGVEIPEGRYGHNSIYLMDGFRPMGCVVPLFSGIGEGER